MSIGLAIASVCAACSTNGGRASDTASESETGVATTTDTVSHDGTDSSSASATGEDTFSTTSDLPTQSQSDSATEPTSASDTETRTLPELDTDYTTDGLESGEMAWITFAESWHTMYARNVAVTGDGTIYWALSFDRYAFFPFVEQSVLDVEGVQADNSLLARYDGPRINWVEISRSKSLQARGSEPVGLLADADGVTMIVKQAASDLVFSPDDEDETASLGCHSGACGYVIRFDSEGSAQWVYQPAGTNGMSLTASAATDDGFALTGIFRDDLLLGEGEENETLLESDWGLESMFVSAHEADGKLLWARGEKAGHSCVSEAVTVTPSGAVVAVGRYTNQATFGEEAHQVHFETPEIPTTEAFIVRYDADGKFEWAKRAVGVQDSFHWGSAVVALADDSVIFMGFSEKGAPTFGEGEPNETKLAAGGFTFARYSADGSLLWAKRGGDGWVKPLSAVALPDGDIIVGGGTWGPCALGVGEPNEVVFNDPPLIGTYGFIARFRDDGTLVWVKRFGQATDSRGNSSVKHVTLSPDGKALYATGIYTGKDIIFAEGEPNEVMVSSYQFPKTAYDTPMAAVLMRLVP